MEIVALSDQIKQQSTNQTNSNETKKKSIFYKEPDKRERPVRYKPIPINKMAEETGYSVTEVKFLYRAFKQECPTGISSEEKFKDIYQKLFPLGDSSKYARLVFRSIDVERTGGITFGDFMGFLSVLTKGSTMDKMLWSFDFYDINKDGVISRDEMMKVILP